MRQAWAPKRAARKWLLGVLASLAWGSVAPAQGPAPIRDGAITGQVVDGVTGRPVSAVLVTFGGAMPGPAGPRVLGATPPILTGADGRFVFQGLAAGSFTVTATRGGYAEGASGRRRPGGASQPIVLTEAQRSRDVQIRVWKNGAITGTVIDEAGEPVIGLQLRALARTLATGRRQFNPAGPPAFTDDRGVYRFSNLSPGDYIVMASPPPISVKSSIFEDVGRTGRGAGELASSFAGAATSGLQVGDARFALARGSAVPPPPAGGRMHVYPPTFHPSAHVPAQASVVALTSGEERAAIDIQLLPVATARVSGSLLSPAGPAGMVAVRLLPSGSPEVSPEALAPVSFSDSTGAFTFAAVVPGQYVLRATGSGTDQGSWVEIPITVAGDDLDGVTAVLRPPLRITAKMQFEGSSERPPAPAPQGRPTGPPFTLEPVERPVGPLSIGAAFTDQGIVVFGYLPGRYVVRVANSPRGWMFKSATLNGVDVSETPFELSKDIPDLVLTFTDRWSGVSGSIQGTAADGATVLTFPTDSQSWTGVASSSRRLRSARASSQGQFGIGSLPPGDYYIVAVPDEDAAGWRDPATLEGLARVATRLTIMEGEHKTLDLQLREVHR